MALLTRRSALWLLPTAGLPGILPAPRRALAADGPSVRLRVLRNPGCECCEGWATHLRRAGFGIDLSDAADLDAVRRGAGVPDDLAGCHTGTTSDGRFVIEGHVPAFAVRRFLNSPGPWRGIAVPSMPTGSPGMEMPGTPWETYSIVAFTTEGRRETFARARGHEPA